MRKALLLLLALVPAAAEGDEPARAALRAMDALIAKGDTLAAAGRTAEALAAYRAAVAVYERLEAGDPTPAADGAPGALPVEVVVEEPARPRRSRWDPPADLGHLEGTPAAQREVIDGLIAVMLDPEGGRESLVARTKLAALGKPAFLPVLGAMARIRDRITDEDTLEERLLESSLKLADECLREMDGFLDAHEKAALRPGTDKRYIEYILRLHYRRWQEVLRDLPEMPGPHAPEKD